MPPVKALPGPQAQAILEIARVPGAQHSRAIQAARQTVEAQAKAAAEEARTAGWDGTRGPSGVPPPPDRTLLGGPWHPGNEHAQAASYQQHGKACLQNLEDQADHWLAYHLVNKPYVDGPFEPS